MTQNEYIELQLWAMRLGCDSEDVDLALYEARLQRIESVDPKAARDAVRAYALKNALGMSPIR